jgi:quinol monooxygenase YgiN
MSITRINEFVAKDGHIDDLLAFLASIVPLIVSSDGCRSCQILQSQEDPARIMMIEVWDTVDAHKASLKNIPAGTFKKTSEMLAAPPRGEYYTDYTG